ncbi:hypothetical protein IQE94_01825 [Synechocystis sp. PCC 7339]|uniref:hypothetical protein n=1 Tax=Synechocystis sp. PCC 7339 TaxID=2782213 RepID=UPI001CBCDE8E|nr:hypothetical protein [Synechocystis sp. PCC 7339]UAJ73110.1 hypothetical protein IQE94_01825 [Synechocystis sp. PCC 7339]
MKITKVRLAIAFAVTVLFGQPAFADTYILLMNGLDEKISINGSAPLDGEGGGIWSPLDATIITSSGKKIGQIKDMHQQCPQGGWLIRGAATTTTDYCIQLGFAEVGCLLAILDEKDSKYTIEMEKVRGTVCSDQWFNTKGKTMFLEAYDLYERQTRLGQDGAKAAAEFISAVKGK